MSLYHYTDRPSLADILREGVLRARSQTLYRHPLGANAPDPGPTLTTPPIVWLTSNPILEMTTVVKRRLAGVDMAHLPGDLCRVVLPDGYAGDLGLGEWTEKAGIAPDWWEWVVRTGSLAGSHYTTWRIVDRDVPAADWLRCEVLAGFTGSETTWTPAT